MVGRARSRLGRADMGTLSSLSGDIDVSGAGPDVQLGLRELCLCRAVKYSRARAVAQAGTGARAHVCLFDASRVIIKLGPPAAFLKGFDIDTAWFSGNEVSA